MLTKKQLKKERVFYAALHVDNFWNTIVLPKWAETACLIANLRMRHEKKSRWLQIRLQTHWITLHVNVNNVTLIALELNKFQKELKSLEVIKIL